MSREKAKGTIGRVRSALVLAALATVLAGTAGCTILRPGGGVTPLQLPDGPAGITGEIRSIDRSGQQDIWGSMLVEGGQQPAGAVSDKAMVTVTEQTLLAQGDRGIPADALKVGMKVRVWFEGPVAESYPVQGIAGFILAETASAQ